MSEKDAARGEVEALEALLGGAEPETAAPGGDDGEVALLLRLNGETLGLLGYAVPTARLDPTRKARLLEVARAAEPRIARGAVDPIPFRVPAVRTAPASPGRSSWPFRIAATIAIVALGLSGWLGWQLERGRTEERETRALLAQLGERARRAEIRAADGDRLRETLSLLTSQAVSVCVLAPPVGGTPGAPRGVMYVASDHQHWYLRLEGLRQPPAGHEYRVWFLVNGTPRSAGRVSAEPDQPAEIGSDTMPQGTGAVLISLEPAGVALAEPSGERVLFGDRMQEIS